MERSKYYQSVFLLWCSENELLGRLWPALLILCPQPHLVLTVRPQSKERELLSADDSVIPARRDSLSTECFILEFHLSLVFLVDTGGMMFVQFVLLNVLSFLFCEYNLCEYLNHYHRQSRSQGFYEWTKQRLWCVMRDTYNKYDDLRKVLYHYSNGWCFMSDLYLML